MNTVLIKHSLTDDDDGDDDDDKPKVNEYSVDWTFPDWLTDWDDDDEQRIWIAMMMMMNSRMIVMNIPLPTLLISLELTDSLT